MKILKCSNSSCERTQKEGKFCLDCGSQLKEVITSEVKFKPIDTTRTADQLKKNIRNWLSRIGVQQPDIHIGMDESGSEIEYVLKGSKYTFKSVLQKNRTNNLAAIEQFLHSRVLSIERGIENLEQAFAGYEALPGPKDIKDQDPYQTLGFKEKVSWEEVKKKYKRLVHLHHPDKGGNPEIFTRIQEAFKKIEEEINNEE